MKKWDVSNVAKKIATRNQNVEIKPKFFRVFRVFSGLYPERNFNDNSFTYR